MICGCAKHYQPEEPSEIHIDTVPILSQMSPKSEKIRNNIREFDKLEIIKVENREFSLPIRQIEIPRAPSPSFCLTPLTTPVRSPLSNSFKEISPLSSPVLSKSKALSPLSPLSYLAYNARSGSCSDSFEMLDY